MLIEEGDRTTHIVEAFDVWSIVRLADGRVVVLTDQGDGESIDAELVTAGEARTELLQIARETQAVLVAHPATLARQAARHADLPAGDFSEGRVGAVARQLMALFGAGIRSDNQDGVIADIEAIITTYETAERHTTIVNIEDAVRRVLAERRGQSPREIEAAVVDAIRSEA